MQTAENMRKIVGMCTNYYSIIEEPIAKDDLITRELYDNYKLMVQNATHNNEELRKLILFDESLYYYFNNEKFKESFLSEFNKFDSNCPLEILLCNKYISYKNDPNNKISNTKWI